MEWFKHKTASHDDPDISDCEDIFGDAGYTVFFKLCEIYGQEFNHLDDGWLDVSKGFLKRKLRKSWTKVEQILSFYQEIPKKNKNESRILYKVEYCRVRFKIPNFMELASNWSKRKKTIPTEAPTYTPTAIEEEVEEEVEEEKKEKEYKEKETFNTFREKYPGTKRGNETEFNNFKKKHKDWKEVISLLSESLEKQTSAKQSLKDAGKFCPEWKHLTTWINNRCWEEEIKPYQEEKWFD